MTSVGVAPLTDMGSSLYKGYVGGLYPYGRNDPPDNWEAAALQAATNIVPRDPAGNASPTGQVVLISIGLSNTTQEYAQFKVYADADPAKSPSLVVVDGAQSGQDCDAWTNLSFITWSNVTTRLAAAGVTSGQVGAAWVKLALKQPTNFGAFPLHAQYQENRMEVIAKNLLVAFPNIRIAYVSARTRAYTTNSADLSPEPYAFESNFGMKWLVENQINGSTNLNWDPAAGPVKAPFLKWGPYLWVDGTNARSDGLKWACTNLSQADFIHPSTSGVQIVATQLMAFFKTDPSATPWFLKHSVTSLPPVCVATANVVNGSVPLAVNFSSISSDPDGFIRNTDWTFDDGTYSCATNPVKTFFTPGVFNARVTVTDNSGATTTCVVTVTASDIDSDGDGEGNLAEVVAGTDPSNSASVFRATQVDFTSGQPVVTWNSASNKFYTVRRSTNLVNSFSDVLATNLAASPPQNSYTDSLPAASPTAYQVEVKP